MGQDQTCELNLPTLHVNLDAGNPVIGIDNIVELIGCRETPIVRFDWWSGETFYLIMSHDPKHANLSRVTDGVCMFIEDHEDYSSDSQLGKIFEASVEAGELKLSARVDTDPGSRGEKYLSKVRQNISPGISIGADIYELTVVESALYEDDPTNEYRDKKLVRPATLMATSWQLLEVSAVLCPAISNTGVVNNSNNSKFNEAPKHSVRLIGDTGYGKEDFKNIFHVELTEQAPMTTAKDPSLDLQIETLNTQLSDSQEALKLNRATLAKTTSERDEAMKLAATQATELSTANAAIETFQGERHKFNVERQYQALRNKAKALTGDSKKLSQAEFDRKFAVDPSEDIQRLQGDAKWEIKLGIIEGILEDAEQRSPLVNAQSKLAQVEFQQETKKEGEPSKNLKEAQSGYAGAWQG